MRNTARGTCQLFRIERKKSNNAKVSKSKNHMHWTSQSGRNSQENALMQKRGIFCEMNQRSLSVVTNSPNISRNWLSSAVMIMFFEILLEINSLVDLLPSICGLKFVSSRDMLSRQSVCFLLLELPSQTFFLSLSSDSCLVTSSFFVFTNLISNIANWCQVQRVEWVCRRENLRVSGRGPKMQWWMKFFGGRRSPTHHVSRLEDIDCGTEWKETINSITIEKSKLSSSWRTSFPRPLVTVSNRAK